MPITFQHDVPFTSTGPAAVAVGQGQKARYDLELSLKQQAEQQQASMEAARLAQQAYQFEADKDMQEAQREQAAYEAQAARDQQKEMLSLQHGYKLDDYDLEVEDQYAKAVGDFNQRGFEYSPEQQAALNKVDVGMETIKHQDDLSEQQRDFALRAKARARRKIMPNKRREPDPWEEGDLDKFRKYDPETGLVYTRQADGSVKSEKAGDTKLEIELREREAIRKEQADQNKHDREIASGERKERAAEDKGERDRIAGLSKNVSDGQQRLIKLKTEMQSRAAKAAADAMDEVIKENPKGRKPDATTLSARQKTAIDQISAVYQPLIEDAENDLGAFKADQISAMQSYSMKSNGANRVEEMPQSSEIPAPEAIQDVAQPGPAAQPAPEAIQDVAQPGPAAQPAPEAIQDVAQPGPAAEQRAQPAPAPVKTPKPLTPSQQAAQPQFEFYRANIPQVAQVVEQAVASGKWDDSLMQQAQNLKEAFRFAADPAHQDAAIWLQATALLKKLTALKLKAKAK